MVTLPKKPFDLIAHYNAQYDRHKARLDAERQAKKERKKIPKIKH